MKTNELNHKVYLYKPSGQDSDFLGELLVDNLSVDIKLHDISSINFTIPRVVNGTPNIRIDEVLDNYIVELHYGRIFENYPNDFFKMRFVIYTTPSEFSDNKFIHSYQGSSTESLLEFKLISNWPGVEVYDFFRSITYTRADNNFDEGGATEYLNQESNATTKQRYIRLEPVKPNGQDAIFPLDIFLYEVRKKTVNNILENETKNALIEFNYAGKTYTHADFKVGFYYLELNGDGTIEYIYIALPDDKETFVNSTNNYLHNTFTSTTVGNVTTSYTFEYRLYDNPISKTYAIGPNTNNQENPLNDMYITLATDADSGDLTPEYGDPQISYNSQEIYSKNGLTLRQILTGKTLESSTTSNEDGLLHDTEYTIGTIHADIEDLFRSNLEFNNITRLQAIKQVAESFKAVIIFDTIAKTMSFFPENEYGTNKGLILRYASYLKSLSKEVDSSKIITLATAIGKDKTSIALVNPSGKQYWEDYAYFLDSFHINTDDNSILDLINTNNITLTIDNKILKTDYITPQIDKTHAGLKIRYTGSTAGFKNRWLSTTAQAKSLAEWQFARDLYHEVLLGNINPTASLPQALKEPLERYFNLYKIRDNEIRDYVKKETQLAEYEAAMYKSKYLYEYYKKEWDTLTKTQQIAAKENLSESWLSFNKYNVEFNNKTIIVDTYKNDILNPITEKLFGTAASPFGSDESTLRKLLEVQSSLHRQNTETEVISSITYTTSFYAINPIESLNDFKRNAVNNDSSVDNELELLKSTKIYLDENKYPKITISLDVASLISAEEAKQDWNKSFIGDKLYVFLPELNVDLEIQVREISIDFESNSMSLTISNVRNYNRTFGRFLTKIVRNLYNSNQNITTFYQDQFNEGSDRANVEVVNRKGENNRFSSTNKTATGAQDSESGKSSVTTTGAGTEQLSVDSVDEALQTFILADKALKGLSSVDGALIAYNDGNTIRTEVEISGDNGIVIKKIDKATSITTKQVFIDTNGNASFAGNLVAPSGDIGGFSIGENFIRAGADDTKLLLRHDVTNPFLSIKQSTNGYGLDGIFLGVASTNPKFSMVTDSGNTFFKYDPSANFDLEIAGNAKIGPLFVANNDFNQSTLTTTNVGLTYHSGANPITQSNKTSTLNLTHQSGQEIISGNVTLSAFSGTDIIASITLFSGANGGGTNLGSFSSDNLANLGGVGGLGIPNFGIRNVRSFVISVDTNQLGATYELPLNNIQITAYKPSIQINDFTVRSSGELSASKIKLSPSTQNPTRDTLLIEPAAVGSSRRFINLTTPETALAANRTIRLPDANGTLSLLENNYFATNTNAITRENTTGFGTVFSIFNIIPGTYDLTFLGRYNRALLGVSRSFRLGIHFNDSSNIIFRTNHYFNSSSGATTGSPVTVAVSFSDAVNSSATARLSTVAATTSIVSSPILIKGRLIISGSLNKTITVTIAQSASDANSIVNLESGASLSLVRVI